MQSYFTIFMCDLCDFQCELPEWIAENTSDGFSDVDPVKFACKVSSVVMSLQDNHFEVIPSFDVVIEEDSEDNEKVVIIVGLKNGESIEVHLFLSDYIYIVSSKKSTWGRGVKVYRGIWKVSKVFWAVGRRETGNLRQASSLKKTLEVHKSNHVNSRISAIVHNASNWLV